MSTESGVGTDAGHRPAPFRPDLLAGGTFVALGLAFAIGGAQYDVGSALRMGSGYVPIALGSGLTVLGALILVMAFRGGDPVIRDVVRPPVPWRRAGLLIAAILVFGFTVGGLGLGPALFITTFLAAVAAPEVKPLRAAVTAAGITALCLVVFVALLQLRLPVLGDWLGADVDGIMLGLEIALQPTNILICLLGVTLGTAVGVLPGIGPTATVALLLPITFEFDPVASLIMLAGIYYGAQYGGSTTAILLNLPGESSSVVTALDGHQMAKQGRAGPALATAALGSFFAGTVATIVLALFAPPMARLALQFGPADFFAIVVLGLIASIALASGSTVKALAMIVLGLLLGTIGQDAFTGVPRFTFGVRELYGGLDFVSLAVGLFGLAEIIRNLEAKQSAELVTKKVQGLWLTKDDFRRIRMPVLRGTALGSLLGVLPGGGHVLASFTSYSLEKKLSKEPKRFGTGVIEGVAAPESANNAAAQTSFIPLLSLGLPTHPVMALLVGAFIIQGITPGPNVINEEPELVWGLIASMWVGNLLLVALNLPLIGIWVRMLSVPYNVLFPAIIAFASIGCYSIGLNAWDVFAIAGVGLLGYFLIRWGCEAAPLLLGFVLGPLLEENLRRSMIISRGDLSVFVTRPISASLLAIALVIVVVAVLPSVRRKREVVFQGEDD